MTRAKDISKILTDADISGTLDVTGETTLATHLNLGDGDIIKLGDSADLTIQHDGSDSIITDAGTGRLKIQGSRVDINKSDGSEGMAAFIEDAQVILYHNNAVKLQTTSSGIDVTGGVTTTTASSIEGGVVFNEASADVDFRVESNGNANMLFVDGGNDQVRVGSTDSVANTALRVEGAIKCSFSSGVPTNQSFNQFTEAGANTYNTHFRNYSSNPLAQYILDVSFANASPDNGNAKFVDFRDSTTARCQIRSDGDVINHDNSYGAISDIKLKEQITDASSQWDDIKALTVRKFKFKTDVATGDSDAHWRLGVIAQEVETAGMNNLVTIDADVEFSDDGIISETGTVTKTVKYSVLYMKAVKALQEAMTKIETLETQNNLQETSINDLQKRITALESA